MTTKEILQEARKFVEKGWTQGACARDKNGNCVDWEGVEATSYCLVGALRVASDTRDIDDNVFQALKKASGKPFSTPRTYAFYNDSKHITQVDILNLLDKAIKECE